MLKDGTIKSSMVRCIRIVDYASLLEVFAPSDEFVSEPRGPAGVRESRQSI